MKPIDVSSFKRLFISSDEKTAYIGTFGAEKPNEGSGGIYVLDLKTQSPTTYRPIYKGVVDFAVNEPTKRLYIIGFRAGGDATNEQSFQEFDMIENKVVREIAVCPSTDQRAVALDPTDPDVLYMTEGDFNLIRKVRLSDGAEMGSVSLHGETTDSIYPCFILQDGNMGYIVARTKDIYKLDLSSGESQGIMHLPEPFHGWGFYKGKIYVGSGDKMLVINPDDGTIENEISTEKLCPLLFTFYDDKMALIDYEEENMVAKRLIVFDAVKLTVLKSIELPHISCGHMALVSPDGKKLYVETGTMSANTTVITVYDSSTLNVLNTISIPPEAFRNGATNFMDGCFDESKRVLYLLGFCSVYMIDMDNNEYLGALNLNEYYEKNEIRGWTPTGLCGITLSPSRDKLYVVSGDAHCVYTYDFKQSSWTDVQNIKGYFPTHSVESLDRQYMYIVNERSDSVTMFDTETGTVKKVIYLDEF